MDIRHIYRQTFTLEFWMAISIFGVIMLVLVFALVHGRARPGRKPLARSEHEKLETAYTLFVACLAIFLITNSIYQNSKEDFNRQSPVAPKVTVHVTAFQWCWRFDYAGTGVNVVGDCIYGKPPVMMVPAHEPVRVTVTSQDVVHEWWVPYLRFKMEAIPGHTNYVTVVVNRTGIFPSRCSEFCGLYHFDMRFSLDVVSPKAFHTWLATKEKNKASGAGAPA